LPDLDRIQAYAVELVSLDPDVIFTPGGVTTTVMLQQTQTIPIVFLSPDHALSGAFSHAC
jgi:putative ABC transport system substrate-binding protein